MRAFIIYDGRYRTDPERAAAMSVEYSLKSARKAAKDYGDTVIVEVLPDGTEAEVYQPRRKKGAK